MRVGRGDLHLSSEFLRWAGVDLNSAGRARASLSPRGRLKWFYMGDGGQEGKGY